MKEKTYVVNYCEEQVHIIFNSMESSHLTALIMMYVGLGYTYLLAPEDRQGIIISKTKR